MATIPIAFSRFLAASRARPLLTAGVLALAFGGQPAAAAPPENAPAVEQPASPVVKVTLDQVINECLVADPRIRAGLEAINQAHADALTASLRPNPDLSADVQLLPLTRPFTVTEQGGPPQMDFIVGYPIDWFLFGKRAAAMASATLGIRVSEAEYADLVRRRVLEAALAYFDLLEANELHVLARLELTVLNEMEVSFRKAVASGARSQVELSRVGLAILASKKALREAELSQARARARLRVLLGRGAAERGYEPADSLTARSFAEVPSVEAAFALAVQHRPDMEAMHWRLAQLEADCEVERRKAYPDVKPSLGYTRQFQGKAIGFPDANSWSAWLEMTLPMSNRNQGNRAKAASRVAQGNLELQASMNELNAEIETAVLELTAARAVAEVEGPAAVRLAEQVRDAIVALDKKQGQPLSDVLDARRSYAETYQAHITSLANYWRALQRFQAAVGKQICR